MWFYLLVLDLLKDFFYRSSETDGERIVQRRHYVTPCPCLSYQLHVRYVLKQEERWCGLKPQRQQERKLNTKK